MYLGFQTTDPTYFVKERKNRWLVCDSSTFSNGLET